MEPVLHGVWDKEWQHGVKTFLVSLSEARQAWPERERAIFEVWLTQQRQRLLLYTYNVFCMGI